MKRYLWLIVALILVATTGRAADYLDSLRTMRVAAKMNFGYDSTSNGPVANSVFDQFAKQGMMDVAMRVHAIKAVSLIRLKRDTCEYALDTLCLGVEAVEWYSKDSTRVLKFQPRAAWPNTDKVITQAENNWLRRPDVYDFTDDSLYVHQTPWINGDSLRVTFWKKPGGIVALSALTQMRAQYRHAVLAYVLWRVALSKADSRATIYGQDYFGLVAELRGTNAPVAADSK